MQPCFMICVLGRFCMLNCVVLFTHAVRCDIQSLCYSSLQQLHMPGWAVQEKEHLQTMLVCRCRVQMCNLRVLVLHSCACPLQDKGSPESMLAAKLYILLLQTKLVANAVRCHCRRRSAPSLCWQPSLLSPLLTWQRWNAGLGFWLRSWQTA